MTGEPDCRSSLVAPPPTVDVDTGLMPEDEEPLRVRARDEEEDVEDGPSPNMCFRRVAVAVPFCRSAGETSVGANPPPTLPGIGPTSGVTGRDAPLPLERFEGGRIGAASSEDVDEVVREEHCESLREGGDGGLEASRTRLSGGLNGIVDRRKGFPKAKVEIKR